MASGKEQHRSKNIVVFTCMHTETYAPKWTCVHVLPQHHTGEYMMDMHTYG